MDEKISLWTLLNTAIMNLLEARDKCIVYMALTEVFGELLHVFVGRIWPVVS